MPEVSTAKTELLPNCYKNVTQKGKRGPFESCIACRDISQGNRAKEPTMLYHRTLFTREFEAG